MKRNIMTELAEWKNSIPRKPLVLKGARQIGKTWLMNLKNRAAHSRDFIRQLSFFANIGKLSSGDI